MTIGGTRVPRRVVPGGRAAFPQRAVALQPRAPVGWRAGIGWVPAILRPFPDIADHVVQPKCVRLEATDRRGVCVAVIAIMGGCPMLLLARRGRENRAIAGSIADVSVGARTVGVFSPGAGRAAAGPRGVLPFRLGQQPIALTRSARKPLRVGFRVVPTHAGHGMVIVLWIAGIPPGPRGVVLSGGADPVVPIPAIPRR